LSKGTLYTQHCWLVGITRGDLFFLFQIAQNNRITETTNNRITETTGKLKQQDNWNNRITETTG
jgi:hypothetical protein